MSILEVNRVTKRFGGLVANDDVSLELAEQEILGLIGPNGAGKTTLFNCITGFHKVTSGRVVFNTTDITSHAPHKICKEGIARTFQVTQVLKQITVLENVMVGGFLRHGTVKETRQKAEAILAFIGLTAKKDLLGGKLSSPEQRRLEIAMALATEPKILMLDEAMAGLNETEIDTALTLIRQIRQQGIAIVVIEHVMRAVMSVSDRVVVLDSGQKIAEGTPEEIVNDERVIKAYLGESYNA